MTAFNDRHTAFSAVEGEGFLLWQVSNAWQRDVRLALSPIGLTYVQAVLLLSLMELEAARGERERAGPVTQGALARFCRADATMTSQVLRSLEQKGLVDRRIGDDARTRHPALTETGRSYAGRAGPILDRVDRAFFGPVAGGRFRDDLRRLQPAAPLDC